MCLEPFDYMSDCGATTPSTQPAGNSFEANIGATRLLNGRPYNHDNVSVFFPAIELKIAMKTWDILKATYLIASLHISNEHTAYLFEISRYINI